MFRDWRDLTYLTLGGDLQQEAAATLQRLGIFSTLAEYMPLLAGTIPLDLAVAGSDLDIICEAHDLGRFAQSLTSTYGHVPGFHVGKKEIRGVPSVVASFEFEGLPVEVFGQPQPVDEQYAYRHLDVEARLLEIGGPAAREEILRLKRAGLKTEPAFARYFNLPGDPYETLLSLSLLDDEELRQAISDNGKYVL